MEASKSRKSSRATSSEEEGKTPTARQASDVGTPNPEDFRRKADDVIPEHDADQEAYKDQIQADSAQDEAKAKAKRIKSDASPAAQETPSGAATVATAGISDDGERGEAYARTKSAVRHGTVAPEDASDVADED